MNNPVTQDEWMLLGPLKLPCRMLELGNKKTGRGVYKPFFESMGVEHVSVDINGEDGALPLDLNKPLNYRELGKFDVVTNFGTSEHFYNQVAVWENMHRALKTDGILVCTTPAPGHMCWHGEWYPTEEFYLDLASLNDYEVEKLFLVTRPYDISLVFFRGRKKSSKKFKMPDESLIYKNKITPRQLPLRK